MARERRHKMIPIFKCNAMYGLGRAVNQCAGPTRVVYDHDQRLCVGCGVEFSNPLRKFVLQASTFDHFHLDVHNIGFSLPLHDDIRSAGRSRVDATGEVEPEPEQTFGQRNLNPRIVLAVVDGDFASLSLRHGDLQKNLVVLRHA